MRCFGVGFCAYPFRYKTQGPNAKRYASAMQRVAIIDLGSNSAHLVAFSYTKNKRFQLLDELREIVRLSEGMGEAKIIRADAFERGIKTLISFKTYCDAMGIKQIKATATSAIREARNGESFLIAAKEKAGVTLELLPGDSEARFGALAVMNSMALEDAVVLDIGGGSLQISLIQSREFVRGQSWPLGTLVSTEAFLKSDPPKKKEMKALSKHVSKAITDFVADLPAGLSVVGMGGTIRNLAKIQKKKEAYAFDILHAYNLSATHLDAVVDDLSSKTIQEKKDISGLNSDRADIITAGGIVIREVMKTYEAHALTISGHGLREGLFYSYLMPKAPHLIKDVRAFSIHNLLQRYYDNKAHNNHVKKLSLSLFDQLEPLHNYNTWERELLGFAALIHDIGMAVNYYDHHKHSFFLVMSAALPGFTHREQTLIALLARYHRKGTPSLLDLEDLLEPEDRERIMKLSALLRLAEYLERSKAQRISDVRCHIAEQYLQIEALASDDVYIELKEANEHSGLLAYAYSVKVEIVLGHST